MRLLAKCLFGTEFILKEEMEQLGLKNIKPGRRAVTFEGGKDDLYKANLQLRTALRILAPFHHFNAKNEQQLYDQIYQFNWESIMSLQQTFAIDSSVSSNYFNHSQYVALKVKDAIVDQFRNKTGKRPSVDIKDPDIRINIHVENDRFTVSTDSSGASLHKRGYRPPSAEAPLNEVLASSMLKIAGWKPGIPLLDPMCGSGTIIIEAAMMARNIPPGFFRQKFGFMGWKNYDRDLWKKVYNEAKSTISDSTTKIYGSDISSAAINLTKLAARDADVISTLKLQKIAFSDIDIDLNDGLIVMNPPYGERVAAADIESKYKSIGDQLKQNYTGCDAWILSGNLDAIKHIGLKSSNKIDLFNGGMKCKYVHYKLYEGSKTPSKNNDE